MIQYEKFRQTLRQVIQQSGLDVGVVLFILKDITREVEQLYIQKVQEEAQLEKESKEEQSE